MKKTAYLVLLTFIFACDSSDNFEAKENEFGYQAEDDIDSSEAQENAEPFTFSVAQENVIKLPGKPFNISVSTNSTKGHDKNNDYFLSFQFNKKNMGSVIFNGTKFLEGEQIPISHGISNLSFTANSEDDFSIVWLASNSTNEQEKQNMEVDMYIQPKISSVLTWYFGDNKRSCGNGCNWDYHYLVNINVYLDPSASLDIFTISLRNNRINHDTRGEYQSYTSSFNGGIIRGDFNEFYSPTFIPTGSSELYDGQPYTLTVVDSNGVKSSIEGTFTNDKNNGL